MPRRNATWRWMMTATLTVAGAALAGGCSGTTMTSHARGQLEEPGEAPSDGTYSLYADMNPRAVKEGVALKRGDPLGFRTAETGRIIAVAGQDEWTYEDASLHWKRND